MQFKPSILVGVYALAQLTQASPLVRSAVNVVTTTVWETVNSTTTIWLPLASSTTPVLSTSVASVAAQTTTTSSTLAVLSTVSTTPVYTAPAVTSSSIISSTTSSTVVITSSPVAAAPVQSTSTDVSVTSSATPSAAAGSFVQASSSNTCEGSGNACVGDVTHWDGGLGACGWNVDTASDLSVALPVGLMGSKSNGNPYCGRSVTLLNPATGTTVQAKVGDKCMGCVDRALDCTDALFSAITNGTGDGRVSGIEWWFT